MAGDWRSYRLEDFIAFTPEVYFRLIERVNETWWPAWFLGLALGLTALLLALRGQGGFGLALLAPAWICSGVVFHLQHYAEINVAATCFGYAFLAQAGLLLALPASLRQDADVSQRPRRWWWGIGSILAISGLLLWPLLSALCGGVWSRAEVFALHPDPTALVTLGMILICLRGLRAGLAALIPLAWALISALTLLAMQP